MLQVRSAILQMADLVLIDVISDDAETSIMKGADRRKADISQANDGDGGVTGGVASGKIGGGRHGWIVARRLESGSTHALEAGLVEATRGGPLAAEQAIPLIAPQEAAELGIVVAGHPAEGSAEIADQHAEAADDVRALRGAEKGGCRHVHRPG